jgi:hypothetical protein
MTYAVVSSAGQMALIAELPKSFESKVEEEKKDGEK